MCDYRSHQSKAGEAVKAAEYILTLLAQSYKNAEIIEMMGQSETPHKKLGSIDNDEIQRKLKFNFYF